MKTRHPAGKLFSSIIAVVLACITGVMAQRPATLDLSGQWRFTLDPSNQGVTANWFDQSLADKISLPGVLQSQGYGDDIGTKTPWVLSLYDHFWYEREDYKNYTKPGSTKVPFLSQPPKHYTGAAWYQRDIEIPANWTGKHIMLFLERPHWESTVWLDDKKIGSARSLVAPHEFDLGSVTPGKHRLSIRVDNSMILPYRLDAHSVSDSLGMSWNGIVGKIELKATSPVWIEDAQVFTKGGNPTGREGVSTPSATVKIKIGNSTNKAGRGMISANGKQFPVAWEANGGSAEVETAFPGAKPWDEFHPNLQKISLKLTGENWMIHASLPLVSAISKPTAKNSY